MFDKKFKLTEYESMSPVWQKLQGYMEARLETLRLKNDRNRGERDTAFLRGEIAELKFLLSLDKPQPETEPDNQFKD